MPLIELSTALVAAGSSVVVPFVNKVLEKSAQRVGGHVDEHLAALFTRAHDYLAATGRKAQSVEAKIAIPLLQAASLETDETLIERWASLLANAADPAQRVAIQPGFVDVLRQITPIDALVLLRLYEQPLINFFAPTYDLTLVRTAGFEEALVITHKELVTSVDNLLRLRLCSQSSGSTIKMNDPVEQMLVADAVYHTAFGIAFLDACTPPVPMSS